jgi:hypothetical protein
MALFSEVATLERAPACRPNLCAGSTQIHAEIERRLRDGHYHVIVSMSERGDTATARTEVSSGHVRQAGAERNIRIETVQAADGKIVRYCYTVDVTDSQTQLVAGGAGPGQCTTVSPID